MFVFEIFGFTIALRKRTLSVQIKLNCIEKLPELSDTKEYFLKNRVCEKRGPVF